MYDLEMELSKLNNKSSINDIQEYINKMIEERGFDKETKQDVMLLLTEEIGELAKEVRKSTNIKMDEKQSRQENLSDEIADVFMYILAMCRVADVNLLEALVNKEKKNLGRTWKWFRNCGGYN